MSTDVADPYVAMFIEHGTRNMSTEPEKFVQRTQELDTISRTFQHEDANAYPVYSLLPGYPYMPIVDRERNKYGPIYIFRLQLEGISDPNKNWIETDYEESTPESGWDEIRRVVITRDPNNAWWRKGAQLVSELTNLVLPGYENLWVMDRGQRKHRGNTGYFEVSMTLKGLRGEKPFKRTYQGTPQTVNPGKVTGFQSVSAVVYQGWPPVPVDTAELSGTDMTIEWDMPQTSITDVMVTTTPPPTNKFPGFWAPTDPPPIFFLPFFSASYTYHVPFGWKIMNMTAEQLAGQRIWLLSLTFGYQMFRVPNN